MATKLVEKCPCCSNDITISKLICKNCGVSLDGEFEVPKNIFSGLSDENYSFLIDFLTARGNLKIIQDKSGRNYFQVKNSLDKLLKSLNLDEKEETFDMEILKEKFIDNATDAGDIVKNKLIECGGSAYGKEYSGKEFYFSLSQTGNFIKTPKLPMIDLEFRVFNIIEQLLIENGGRAGKGNARSAKLGEPNCTDDTVAGRLGYEFFGKNDGDSFFDCGFIVMAIMEWAGIVYNKRGYIEFTPQYRQRRRQY